VPFGNRDVEQFHHQPDHFAGGEVFPGLLPALLRESPQQLLVDVAHLQRRELVRTEFQLLVLVEDGSQAIVLHHLSDGGPVVEMLDDVVDVLGKPVDVRAEIRFEQRMVFLVDPAQRPFGLVRERRVTGLQVLHELRQFLVRQLGAVWP